MTDRVTGWRPRLRREAASLVSADTWRHTLHLVAAVPWAAATAVLTVVGLALSAALLPVVLSGVPVFLVYAAALRCCASLETRWYRLVLGERVTVFLRPPPGAGWARQARNLVLDSALWRVLAHHLLRLPLALTTGLLTVIAWGGGCWLLIAAAHPPAWPFADTALPDGGPGHALLHGSLRPVTAVLLVSGGLALLLAAPTVVRTLTLVHVALARALLGRASARQLRARIREVERRRADALRAAEAERRRIERDLHDGAQQRLIHLVLTLGMARHRFADDPDGTLPLLAAAQQQARQAIAELRDLTRGLHPPVLADRGLDAALSALAARSPVPVTIDVRLDRRPPRLIESIAYFMASEALSNVAKHARASHARVEVSARPDALLVRVTDDGVGGATMARGSGLAGLADRAHGVDGDLTVQSPPGGPTVLDMELPCAW